MGRFGIGRIATGTLLLSLAAGAQAQFYGGAQFSHLTLSRGSVSNAQLSGITLRGGMVLVPQLFSAELRLGKAFGSDSDSDSGVKAKNDFYYGTLVRMTLPLGKPFTPYAVGGYGYVKTDLDGNTQRDDGGAYGLGVDYALPGKLSVNLEYLRLADNDYTKQELFSLGVNYHF